MNNFKRILAVMLCLLMVFGSMGNVFAKGPHDEEHAWLKKGTVVYINANDNEGYELDADYEIRLGDHKENDGWYRFDFVEKNDVPREYHLVKAEDVLAEKPEEEVIDPTACNCEYLPESGNIADHVDSCPRKQYIKGLFDGKCFFLCLFLK